MIAYMRLFGGLDGMVMVDDEDAGNSLFWFVSKKPGPGHGIFKARWSEAGIEERIDGLLAQVGQHIDDFEWQVYPDDRPADLGKRLETRGMVPDRGGNWMWADLTALPPPPPLPDGFRIEKVNDDAMMAGWLRVSLAGFAGKEICGFQQSYAELASFYDAYARHGYGPRAFSHHYIGFLGDEMATSATLLDAGGTAAIYDLSTPPRFRRKGLGGALTRALMEEIRRMGYAETWIWGSDMARSLYQQLGYIDADFGIRFYRWTNIRVAS